MRTCRHCPRVMPWAFFNHPTGVVNRCDRSTDRADPHRSQDALDVPHPTLPHRRCAWERLRHPPALRSLPPSQAGRLVPSKTAPQKELGRAEGREKTGCERSKLLSPPPRRPGPPGWCVTEEEPRSRTPTVGRWGIVFRCAADNAWWCPGPGSVLLRRSGPEPHHAPRSSAL